MEFQTTDRVSKPFKERLDTLLVTRCLVRSRDEAQRCVLAGLVRVDGILVDKPGKVISREAAIEFLGKPSPFVSRGGEKLSAGIEAFQIDCSHVIAMDVGASTGGFTDCLLQRGVARVYAIDVGYGQLAWKIRTDPRVVTLDRVNIRYLPRTAIPDRVALAVVDVSFISLKQVLPCVIPFLSEQARVVTLIKPQFEVGFGQVGRGGIVRDEQQRQEVVTTIQEYAVGLGFQCLGCIDSPITGRKGNREVVAGFSYSADQ